MLKTLLIISISLIASLSFVDGVFAAASCPAPPPLLNLESERDALRSDATSRIEQCIAARAKNQESSIRAFSCPSGDFNINDRAQIDQVIAYQITVATVFEKIDTNATQYMQALFCLRDRDPIKWDATNNARINGQQYQSAGSYESLYKTYCTNFSSVASLINTDAKKYIYSSDAYPQYFDCMPLAEKKIQSLRNLAAFLTTNGIAKGYENDKDIFLDKVKGKYATLLEKTSRYFRLISQAVAKMDTYLRQTIQ